MLYPQYNPYRQFIDLSGFWEIRFDPKGAGLDGGWGEGVENTRPVAVPASWNDQFEDRRDYLGNGWYQTRFDLPWGWEQQRVHLRFSSVSYMAEVWLNGSRLGEHEGAHLPFEFDITSQMRREDNLLVVRVEAEMDEHRLPPGNVPFHPDDTFDKPSYPNTNCGFFPDAGILRPVLLYTKPSGAIDDIKVTTDIKDGNGLVKVQVIRNVADTANVKFAIRGFGAEVEKQIETSSESVEATLLIPRAALWSPQSPNLYELTVELATGLGTYDQYSLQIGVRTIKVSGETLLLNGEPLSIKGFAHYEDLAVVGAGSLRAEIIKDMSLMRWMGANCFRTSGHPCSEETLSLADRMGWLVIDETPAAGLCYAGTGLEARYNLARRMTKELIARDKNHPSVIMWSLAGEPFSQRGAAKLMLDRMRKDALTVDESRPTTVVSVVGLQETAFDLLDVVCVSFHPAWDTRPGQIKQGMSEFSAALDAIHEKWAKPVIVTEFACDAIPGHHALPSEMWSEEYQAEVVASAMQVIKSKSYVIGQLSGPICDFKTAQSVRYPKGMNHRGMFSRDRRPKLAAHSLRTLFRR